MTKSDRRIHRNLKLLYDLTVLFENTGLDKLEAEKKAGDWVLFPIRTFKPLAAEFLERGEKEKDFIAHLTAISPELESAARKAFRAAKQEIVNG
jgi:hypothetical protein